MRVGAGIIIGVLALAACSSSGKSGGVSYGASDSSSSVPSWVSEVVMSTSEISDTLHTFSADAQAGDLSASIDDCTIALTRVPGWRATAALVTVSSVRVPYQEAIDDLEQAFTACTEYDFTTAGTYFTQGGAHATEASEAVDALGFG